MNRRSKWFLNIVLVFLPMAVLIGIAMKSYWPTQYKVFRYNLPSITDFQIFENRVLPPSTLAVPFSYWPEVDRSLFATRLEQEGLKDRVSGSGTVAFLVLRDGRILYEMYRDGFGPGDPVMVFSITKSMLSLLVSLAIEDGLIESIDQPVSDFLPRFEQGGLARIRLVHLLQMTSGLPYVERSVNNPFGLHAHLSYTDDIAGLLEQVEAGAAPGENFSYKSVDYALLGLVLDRALGEETITDYFYRKLWHPVGAVSTGFWSVDSAEHGMEKTWCCLSMSARDLARFGQLMLNRGRWNGQQLVPADWLSRIDSAAGTAEPKTNYRYGWWRMPGDSFALRAEGTMGQYLYINPERRTVIVRLGHGLGTMNAEHWRQLLTAVSKLAN